MADTKTACTDCAAAKRSSVFSRLFDVYCCLMVAIDDIAADRTDIQTITNDRCDIGTQTIAYTSDKEVGLKNLAERGSAIITNERKERRLNRAMDRSRRTTNPEYYNDDGTIKKGKKNWKYSKRYRKLKARHQELCRINAINRHLAIREDVNHLRSLGDIFVTRRDLARSYFSC
jgi:hypothetical protein